MFRPTIIAVACALATLAGCGGPAEPAPVALPPTGKAYRALGAEQRAGVAVTCRDRAAARARGTAARQLRAIDPLALRAQLDDAFRIIPDQDRSVAGMCAERVPFVTPGLRVSFAGAKDRRDGTFMVQTTSDEPLTIRGRIAPAIAGRVVARRELGARAPREAVVGRDGRFFFANLRLRKIADNTFTLTIHAPPNAPRSVHFTAICLDCLSGGPVPTAQQ